MLPIALGLIAPAAHAEAVIEFKTKAPVQISVDGRQAALQQNLRQRVAGLDPGVHELKVQSMFGKTLYEAEIEIPDNTLTTAAWERGQITVLSTDWLEQEAADEEAVAAEEPVPVEEIAVEAPEEVADVVAPEPPVAEDIEEPALAVPAEPAAPPVEPVVATPAMTLPTAAKTRTLTVQASDGMRIEVVHEGRTVTVVVEGDSFRIVDASGMELALGAE